MMSSVHVSLVNSAGVLDEETLQHNEEDDFGITKAVINWLEREQIVLDHGDRILIGEEN